METKKLTVAIAILVGFASILGILAFKIPDVITIAGYSVNLIIIRLGFIITIIFAVISLMAIGLYSIKDLEKDDINKLKFEKFFIKSFKNTFLVFGWFVIGLISLNLAAYLANWIIKQEVSSISIILFFCLIYLFAKIASEKLGIPFLDLKKENNEIIVSDHKDTITLK